MCVGVVELNGGGGPADAGPYDVFMCKPCTLPVPADDCVGSDGRTKSFPPEGNVCDLPLLREPRLECRCRTAYPDGLLGTDSLALLPYCCSLYECLDFGSPAVDDCSV